MSAREVDADTEKYIEAHLEVDSTSPSGLRWRASPRFQSKSLVGQPAGGFRKVYFSVSVKKRHFMAHRVIWFLLHKEWPESVDHIDGNARNNSPMNLRAASLSENQHNRKCKGYKYDKRKGRYEARITINYKEISLGSFETPDLARQAYLAAKGKFHPTAPSMCFEQM